MIVTVKYTTISRDGVTVDSDVASYTVEDVVNYFFRDDFLIIYGKHECVTIPRNSVLSVVAFPSENKRIAPTFRYSEREKEEEKLKKYGIDNDEQILNG